MHTRYIAVIGLFAALVVPVRPAAQQAGAPADIPIGLAWRNIGPGGTGTRIVDFAVVERTPRIVYAATASSGVWKTINAGTTWEPLFQHEQTIALGGIAVSQSNPDIVWVATGEPNMRNLRSSSWGSGIYKSTDAGQTWRQMGLTDAQHMGRVVIHPTNPDVVFATVTGSMWQNNPQKNAVRGLYKTTDGGVTWRKTLSAGDNAGIVDVVIDPTQPNTLYAAAWHRQRRDWSYVNVGAQSGLFKSTDGGETWNKLTTGMPTTPTGRPGVDVCRSRPSTLYAVVEGADGGVYRSLDAGATWTRRNTMPASSMYYGQVRCDPNDPERVYVLQTQMAISSDGGTTFTTNIPGRSVHVDHHALWINPADSDHQWLGNDGGIYQTRDRGATWLFHGQMAATQFYAVAVDMREPFYYVCGGTQDNNSLCGPSATRHTDGIVNDDWYVTTGGDGFALQIDPTDPSVVYTEAQYGALVQFNPFTGQRRRITPQPPEGQTYRWNWNSPMRLSPHDPNTLYYGGQFLFRTRDRGATWDVVSPDLTRQITIDPQYLISPYGTLLWIDESPRRRGWLAVGTDDGLIHVTEDGGSTWRQAAPIPGVPDRAQMRRVLHSAHDDRTLYVAASAHEDDDFRPMVAKSIDHGRTWTRIESNLPAGSPVLSLLEDPVNPRLLFAGTQSGIYATLDAGARWFSLRLNLPTSAVHDMVIHPREGDLVIGTHGRGMWVLDSLAGLRGLTPETLATAGTIFTPRPAFQLTRFDRGRNAYGSAYFAAPNPPDGVYLDVYLNPSGTDVPSLEIADATGRVVRRLTAPTARGLQRVVWDMRGDAPAAAPGAGRGGRGGGSPLVVPGTYEARFTIGGVTTRVPVMIRPDPSR
jgi:photosystem II stability/assembly factor-like uncharacterized protein